jgi:hypothetical protein
VVARENVGARTEVTHGGDALKKIADTDVRAVFASYPPAIRRKLLALRSLILKTAASTPGVGALEETLKWGEPAYITKSRSGSTIRLGWKESNPRRYAMYFNCRTNLVETFRTLFPSDFTFAGNRAIIFDDNDIPPTDALAYCIGAALTYHRRKRQ